MNTFTKIDARTWGVKVEGNAQPGDTVQVTTRDGETKSIVLGQAVCTIFAIVPDEREERRRQDRAQTHYRRPKRWANRVPVLDYDPQDRDTSMND